METLRPMVALDKLASGASSHEMFHILGHAWKIVVLFEHGASLLNAKVFGQRSTMELLNQEFPKPTLWYAKSDSLEEESMFQVEQAVGVG